MCSEFERIQFRVVWFDEGNGDGLDHAVTAERAVGGDEGVELGEEGGTGEGGSAVCSELRSSFERGSVEEGVCGGAGEAGEAGGGGLG